MCQAAGSSPLGPGHAVRFTADIEVAGHFQRPQVHHHDKVVRAKPDIRPRPIRLHQDAARAMPKLAKLKLV